MASSIADLFCEESLPYLIEKHNQDIISFLSCRNYNDMEENEKLLFTAFKEKLSHIKFLPVMGNPSKKVSLQEAALIEDGIEQDLNELYEGEIEFKDRFIINSDWSAGQKIENLEKLGAKRLQKKDLIELIGKNSSSEPSWCGNGLHIILKWIEKSPTYNSQGGETQNILLSILGEQKLFLTDKKKLRSLTGKNLSPMFLSLSGKNLKVPSFLKLDFLNSDIFNDFEDANKKTFSKKLDLLSPKGLHKFSAIEVIKQAVLPFIESSGYDKISDNNKASLLRFLAELKPNEKRFEETEPYSCFDEIRNKLSKKINV
jgi:hypothetical protein